MHLDEVGDDKVRAELRARVAHRALSDGFRFPGSRHDIRDLLCAADMCVRLGIVEGSHERLLRRSDTLDSWPSPSAQSSQQRATGLT